MSRTALFLLLLCVVIFSGCTRLYVPTTSSVMEPILEFTSDHSVSLINVQESDKDIPFKTAMSANLKVWTDVAIQITDRELAARGMTSEAGAPLSLGLAITEAEFTSGWVKLGTQITMKVETGDGYAATYVGLNNSAMAANVHRQVDGALMRVVAEMLKDQKIIDYLSQ